MHFGSRGFEWSMYPSHASQVHLLFSLCGAKYGSSIHSDSDKQSVMMNPSSSYSLKYLLFLHSVHISRPSNALKKQLEQWGILIEQSLHKFQSELSGPEPSGQFSTHDSSPNTFTRRLYPAF